MHLVIAFNNAHYKKTSNGEKVLRIIMNKFNKINNDVGSTIWGHFYTGLDHTNHDYPTDCLRNQLYNGTMSYRRAKQIIGEMDPNAPWYSVKDFVSSLATLTACYWSAVDRTTNVNGVKLYHVIWSATAPDRVQ